MTLVNPVQNDTAEVPQDAGDGLVNLNEVTQFYIADQMIQLPINYVPLQFISQTLI